MQTTEVVLQNQKHEVSNASKRTARLLAYARQFLSEEDGRTCTTRVEVSFENKQDLIDLLQSLKPRDRRAIFHKHKNAVSKEIKAWWNMHGPVAS